MEKAIMRLRSKVSEEAEVAPVVSTRLDLRLSRRWTRSCLVVLPLYVYPIQVHVNLCVYTVLYIVLRMLLASQWTSLCFHDWLHFFVTPQRAQTAKFLLVPSALPSCCSFFAR